MNIEIKVWNSKNEDLDWLDFIKLTRDDKVTIYGITSNPQNVSSLIKELKNKLERIPYLHASRRLEV